MFPGAQITSPDGSVSFTMQSNGNFVGSTSSGTFFSMNTYCSYATNVFAALDSTGNFYVYNSATSSPCWQSNSGGLGTGAPYTLSASSSNYLVITDSSGNVVWTFAYATSKSCIRRCLLCLAVSSSCILYF